MTSRVTDHRWRETAFLGLVALWGCGLYPSSPAPAIPVPPHRPSLREEIRTPRISPFPVPLGRGALELRVGAGFTPPDPILDASWTREPGMRALVESSLASLRGPEAAHMRRVSQRMEVYRPWVEREVKSLGFPRSLVFLPLLESGYDPAAGRSSGPMGLWQILPGTARSLGLRIDAHVDERRDPVASTRAALRYLASLRDDLGSWPLALMAYNAGPARVRSAVRSLQRAGGGGEPSPEDVLARLPSATRRFLPRFLALATLGRDPEANVFPLAPSRLVEALAEVEVVQALSLERVATLTGVDLEFLRAWNPHLLRGGTPGGRPVRLRLPLAAVEAWQAALAEGMEAGGPRAGGYREHLVAPGETLSHLARRYGVRLEDLHAANPSLDPRRLAVGARVVIPPPSG